MTSSLSRYRILEPLGEGGFGRVDLAEDLVLSRRVALKRLHPGVDQETQQRFLREAQITSGLRHPHVIEVFDFGMDPEGVPFLVCERIEGCDLSDYLERFGPPDPPRALAWASQLAEALAAVHDQGLVHRDVKPANVLVRRDGSLVLGDFGLVLPARGEKLTETGVILGTPAFMAPELWGESAASAASDQFAWAATLVEVLAGGPVYGSTEPAAILERLRLDHPVSLPDTLAARYPALVPILERALSRSPGARFSDCHQLLAALRSSSGRDQPTLQIAATPPAPAPAPAPGSRRLGSGALLLAGALLATLGWWIPLSPTPRTAIGAEARDQDRSPSRGDPALRLAVEAAREDLWRLFPADFPPDALPGSQEDTLIPEVQKALVDPRLVPRYAAWIQSSLAWIESLPRPLGAPTHPDLEKIGELLLSLPKAFREASETMDDPRRASYLEASQIAIRQELQDQRQRLSQEVSQVLDRLAALDQGPSLHLACLHLELANRSNVPSLARCYRRFCGRLPACLDPKELAHAVNLLADEFHHAARFWPLPCETRALVHRTLMGTLAALQGKDAVDSLSRLVSSLACSFRDCPPEDYPEEQWDYLPRLLPELERWIEDPTTRRKLLSARANRSKYLLRGAASCLEHRAATPELQHCQTRFRELAEAITPPPKSHRGS